MSQNPVVINRLLRLPSNQFMQEVYPKKQLYIHHTVGGSAKSSFDFWMNSPDRVGTAFIIDRDGTIFETFDPRYWAYHLGLKHKRNDEINRASIGIELASEGALQKDAEGVLRAFNGKAVFRDTYIDNQFTWRGYRYFDSYEPEQTKSLFILVKYLCEQHSIPKKCIPQAESTLFHEKYFDFSGILGHCNVRSDKTDPHPRFRFDHLQGFLDGADLGEVVPIP